MWCKDLCFYQQYLPELLKVSSSSDLTKLVPKILRSLKWGFTQYPREQYVELRKTGILSPDGNIVKVHNRRGPLQKSSLYLDGKE